MGKRLTITVLDPDPDPETLKFSVLVSGWREDWTLDEIKAAVARGADLKEWAR